MEDQVSEPRAAEPEDSAPHGPGDDPAAGPREESADAAEMEALREEVERLGRVAADAKDAARRYGADLENVKRRARAERDRFHADATEKICRELLPILDNLERAADAAAAGDESEQAGAPADDALRKGVVLTLRRFRDALARLGVVEIEAAGRRFDPHLHQAVQRVPATGDQQDEEIVHVQQRGFATEDRVIRPAIVVVAQRADEPESRGNGRAEEEPEEILDQDPEETSEPGKDA